jgi:hypothetical protein
MLEAGGVALSRPAGWRRREETAETEPVPPKLRAWCGECRLFNECQVYHRKKGFWILPHEGALLYADHIGN